MEGGSGSCYDVHLAGASDLHVLILEATGRPGTVSSCHGGWQFRGVVGCDGSEALEGALRAVSVGCVDCIGLETLWYRGQGNHFQRYSLAYCGCKIAHCIEE